jgi:hypothetical protein
MESVLRDIFRIEIRRFSTIPICSELFLAACTNMRFSYTRISDSFFGYSTMLFQLQTSNEIGIYVLAGEDFEGDDCGIFQGSSRTFC